MVVAPNTVIKKANTCSSGSLPLRPGACGHPDGHKQVVQPAARIVKQGETAAIIEVTCGCGQRMQVVCEFPLLGDAAKPPDRTAEQQAPEAQ